MQLYESDADGNPVENGAVIDCVSDFSQSGVWSTFYSYTAEVVTQRSFFNQQTPDVLTSLSVGYTLSPSFASKTYAYSVTLPYSATELNIQTALADGAAIAGIIGNESLEVGVPKNVTIAINDSEGGVTTYTITVTREQDLTGKIKAMHLREWKEIGTERTVVLRQI